MCDLSGWRAGPCGSQRQAPSPVLRAPFTCHKPRWPFNSEAPLGWQTSPPHTPGAILFIPLLKVTVETLLQLWFNSIPLKVQLSLFSIMLNLLHFVKMLVALPYLKMVTSDPFEDKNNALSFKDEDKSSLNEIPKIRSTLDFTLSWKGSSNKKLSLQA